MYSAWSQKASNYIRACSPTDTSVKPQTLESVNTTSELVFRTNHRLVVLNDTVNGNVWNPEDSTKVIKIQWNKIQTEQTEKEQQNNDSANNHHDFSKTCSAQSGQSKPRMMKSAHEPVRNRFSTRCAMTSRPIVPY